MLDDIRKMILLISAFTKPHTEGEKLLDEWEAKYSKSQNDRSVK